MDIRTTPPEKIKENPEDINIEEDVNWEDLDVYDADTLKALDVALKKDVSEKRSKELYYARERARGRGKNQGIPPDQDWVWHNSAKKDRCIATSNRTGERCKKPSQKGKERCWQHGAGTLDRPAGYSEGIQREMYKMERDGTELQNRVNQIMESNEIDDARTEYAKAIAVLDQIDEEKYESGDLSAQKMLDQIDKVSRIMKRAKEVEFKNALNQKEVKDLMYIIQLLIKRYVPDHKQDDAYDWFADALRDVRN